MNGEITLQYQKNNVFFFILDISIFSPLFQNCVKKMTDILYRLQHRQNGNSIYDPEDFLNMISAQAPELRQFFDMLYQSTNPTGKCEKTNTTSKGQIVVLCYQLASLRNKQMTLLKRDAGLFFQHSGLSKKGIDTLSNIGISTTFKTINQTRVKIKRAIIPTTKPTTAPTTLKTMPPKTPPKNFPHDSALDIDSLIVFCALVSAVS